MAANLRTNGQTDKQTNRKTDKQKGFGAAVQRTGHPKPLMLV